jgi:GPH family glycoside/pentoside/hexuronide:cation symporter
MPAEGTFRFAEGTVRREGRLVAYASGNFGKALVFSSADLTILFLLTDLLGLSAAQAGTLMLVAVAGDLVLDLIAAKLVIRLRRRGRGYRWLVIAGAVPCGLAFAGLYAMPLAGLRTGWALAAAMLVFRGAYAIIDVPHNALMARITRDSRARGRASGYRLMFSTASALTVALLFAPLVQEAGRTHAFATLAVAGAVAGLLFAVTMVVCALGTGEGPDAAAIAPEPARPEQDGIAVPLRDPLVLGMGLVAFITGFAAPTFGRMLLYLGTYVIDRPELVGALLLAMTVGQFVGVLVWTALTARYDQNVLLAAGHGVTAVAFAMFALCLGHVDLLLPCTVLIGFGLASVFMLPWGLLANAVDFVALRHGRRFETGLFAFYLVVTKASGAAATVLIGWVLGGLGYVPGAVQGAAVEAGMMAFGLGVPFAGCLLAIVLLRRFDLGAARHARVLAALGVKAARTGRRLRQSGAEPVSGLNRGLVKSSGAGVTLAGGSALSRQARHSMSRSIEAPAAVRS